MMRIFKKRAYSASRGFEGTVVDDEEDEVQSYADQVDLMVNLFLAGFMSDSSLVILTLGVQN